ncbi:MotA/TolQ/ExbB proton channel family protein [Gammaproteobacteria bacterium]|jgi:biopolymer transport protein ExbB|nr:MotA/TolQ/ExbB proton channel family protein [Gammaproteobacteria bacterium]MDA7702732.1 MotA/TolQ/ExbB proton channel family protein [Gammaproteobacteria bacterium]MDA8868086.1 MotA/TolQ/ExbB proton channel family protein [Gammaproteobacteria bacterium]MDB0023512.1 MotA/TolQ/ExbB proton channel family protein [Gammaproteobacteria bacterium]MDB3915463.1 MotA/TolQ/ExbB proton channel family protein [Gammaproteobacteria bacterium]|tara:strand:+ start:629 stop:1990 length:1362 start_codon:yes stop_codon:yes gene_type:complete
MNKKLYLLPFLIFALNAQEPTPAPVVEPVITDLDLLVESVKTTASIRAKEDKARLNKFLSDKNKQQSLLDNMKYKLTLEERRSERLTKQYEDNDAELSDLEEQLTLKLGSFGELFGIVRQTAGESKGQFSLSLTNIEFPGRIDFLGDLAERKSLDLPTTEELERLWYEILNELNQSGKVKSYNTDILTKSGELVNQDVLRIGVFNSVSNGDYLNLVAEQNLLEYLAKQPERSIRRSAKKLQNSDDYREVFIDPTRGSLLTKLIDRDTWLERINAGGFVGYVIIIILTLGLVMGAMRFKFLNEESKSINKELETNNFSDDSILGKLNSIYSKYSGNNPEDLESQLEDILAKATPPLEKNLSVIKLLAAVAPLLGLLGTVIGMIETFQAITLFGTGDPKLMAGGISQALVTTMLGLIAAVPLLFVHNILDSRSRAISQIYEEQAIGLLALVSIKK